MNFFSIVMHVKVGMFCGHEFNFEVCTHNCFNYLVMHLPLALIDLGL